MNTHEMKKMVLGMVMGIGMLAVLCGPVLANENHHGFGDARGGHGKGSGGELDGMFFGKAHMILENQKELGLAQDKVEAIKSLELETKKALIKQNADIDVLGLDIMNKLHEYPVNTEAVNKLVDQKFEVKKTMAKGLVEAIAKLKGTLTKDQNDKMRDLWKKSEKCEKCEGKEQHPSR